jgi:predicted nucleic acid-binding protein
MSAVVDTNVVAYYLLGTEPFAVEARQFWQARHQPVAPAHWQAELANVLWLAVRMGALPADEGHRRLDFASRLRVRSVPIGSLWQSALSLSLESGLSAYDTLFVALARRRRLPLVTFDTHVLKAFPDVAQRPGNIATQQIPRWARLKPKKP